MSETAWAWPTPLLHRPLPAAQDRNAALLRVVAARRAASGASHTLPWVSRDDVHRRPRSSAVRELLGLLGQAVYDAAAAANVQAWSALPDPRVSVEIVGAWWQVTNGFGRHDVHNHGNCSWSGVTYIDCDPEEARVAHPRLGPENGVTRLYSPHLARLGGAAMDVGSMWLQDAHLDVVPQPGAVVVWPSFVLHQQLPYDGKRDRVVLAFNAVVQGAGGGARPFGL